MPEIPGAKNTEKYTYIWDDLFGDRRTGQVLAVPHKDKEDAIEALNDFHHGLSTGGDARARVLSGYEEACRVTSTWPGCVTWAMTGGNKLRTGGTEEWEDCLVASRAVYMDNP